MTTLRLEHVSAAPWGSPLLKDLSFTLEPGTVLALAGPNGAGKSSLLGVLGGDFLPTAGDFRFRDRPMTEWSSRERAKHLAVLPQLSLLNFPYTVEEVILLGRIPHDSGRRKDWRVMETLLQTFDLAHLRRRLYTQLSGGEKQRTQLARVFAQIEDEGDLCGKLLLLDEPTSALDLAHQQQVLSAVHAITHRGCCVALAIHDINLALTAAHQIMVLQEGRQRALGFPGEVLTAELFREVFNVEVVIDRHPDLGTPFVLTRSG